VGRASITKRAVDAAKPAAAEYVIWDDEVSGFGLKITPTGSKIYIYRYRIARAGKAARTAPTKYTIGKHGNLTPDQARRRAKDLAAQVGQGIDPKKEELAALAAEDFARQAAIDKARIEGDLVFDKLASTWLAEYQLDHRSATVGQARVSLEKYLMPKLRGRPMPHITKAELQSVIDTIPTGQRATRQQVFAYASILFRWALERGDIAHNPVTSMAKPKPPKARDRVLSDEELVSIWFATGKLRTPLGAFYRLLLLTGQRREEVAGMSWVELNRANSTWVIPASKTKNGVPHIVPLASAVVEELDRLSLARQLANGERNPDASRWPKSGPAMSTKGAVPISGFSQAKSALDAALAQTHTNEGAIAPWRVHDLRRTLATGLQRLGVRFEVTEAVLNHVSGAKSGVAGIYQRHDWASEKRAALTAWAVHIEHLLAGADYKMAVVSEPERG
jgi:integrase